jgi:hypothetical protein
MATRKREVSAQARGVPPPQIDEVMSDDHAAGAARRPSRAGTHSATADRWRRIATAAYLRAERRGFAGHAELQDWLEAEKEVDDQLTREAFARHSPQER